MRGNAGELAGTFRVGSIAGWLLIVFAAGVLAFLVSGADAPDVLVGSVVLLPWIVGPAALAALLAARAWSSVEAWLFVGAEAAAVASTLGFWTLLLLDAEARDAQSGMAILLLPLFQFAALLAYFLIVSTMVPLFGRTWTARG